MNYSDYIRFQVDMDYLKKAIMEHYAYYPPLNSREDVIKAKNRFSRKYGYDALAKIMEEAYAEAREARTEGEEWTMTYII